MSVNSYNDTLLREHISAVEYFLDKEKVTGSTPVAPTKFTIHVEIFDDFERGDVDLFDITPPKCRYYPSKFIQKPQEW